MSGRITALKVQKKNQQRVNVYLDGEFAFGLSRIIAGWLQVGQELDDQKIAELKAKDEKEVAFQHALRLLNYRYRSEAEMQRSLEERKYSPEVISAVIERLTRSGLLDDQRFAENWVENRTVFRPRSKRALSIEMRQRGISDEAISQAVEDLDDEALAYQAGSKQARKYADLEWADFRKKLGGFLQRRGFYYDAIASAIQKIWDEIQIEKQSPDEQLFDDDHSEIS